MPTRVWPAGGRCRVWRGVMVGRVVWVSAGISSRGDSHNMGFSEVLTFLHSGLQQKGQGKSRSHSYLHSDLPGSKKHTAPNERCCSARCLTPHAAQNYCHCLQWGFASLTPGSGEPCAAADASAAPLSDGRKHLAGLAPRGASARGHPSIAALELRPTACACVAVGRAPP